MSEYVNQKQLYDYVNAATILAEHLKRNIKTTKKGPVTIDDKTILALNKFIIAANAIADVTNHLNNTMMKFN